MSEIDATAPEIAAAPESAPPTPPKPTLRLLFFGDDGLRAGWSILLFFSFVILVGILCRFVVVHLHLLPKSAAGAQGAPQEMKPRSATIGETIQFVVFAIPALIMSLIERRSFGRYGLSSARMLPDFAAGLFWGLASLSGLVGVLYLAHGIAFDGVALHGGVALAYAAKWLLVFFLVGLSEEYLFRGYLQYTVARGVAGIVRTMDANNRYSHSIGFWVAAFLFSVVFFAGAHTANGGENFVGIFQVALVGVVFAFSLYRTGTLWWAIGVHTTWDWAQSYLYGTPDSGNLVVGHLLVSHPLGSRLLSGAPDGPEGSVLGIPTLLLLAALIHFTLPKREYPLTADQSAPVAKAI